MSGFPRTGLASAPGLIIPGQSYVPGTVNTRRAILALGGEGDNAATGGTVTPANSDVCQRYGFTIPSCSGAGINRFRLRIRNINALTNTATPGAINFTQPIQIGTPNAVAVGEPQWNADFVASSRVTIIPAPGSVEVGSSEYVSGWISPSTFKLVPGVYYGLTMGYTCSGVGMNYSRTPGWSFAGTGSAAASNSDARPGTTAQPYTQYMDVRLEYEFNATNEIGFFIGDSITSGWLNTITGLGTTGIGHMGPDNTWPSMAGLRLGHHPMNAGIGAAMLSNVTGKGPFVTNLSQWAWARFLTPVGDPLGSGIFACTPDYAVVQLGVNDAADSTGITLSNYQAAWFTLVGILQGLGIQRIYAVTSSPGYNVSVGAGIVAFQAGNLMANPASPITGFSIATLPYAGFGGTGIYFTGPGAGGGQPGPANAWFQATGGPWRCYLGTPNAGFAGPYTISGITSGGGGTWPLVMTISGSPANPGGYTYGSPLLTGSEWNRQTFNKWLRTNPPGVQAVIDFDAAVTTPLFYPSCTLRTEYGNNDGDVHPTGPGMYQQNASQFVNGIVGN